MTTPFVVQGQRRVDARIVLGVPLLAAWAVVVVGGWLGYLTVPGLKALTFGVPAALTLAAVMARRHADVLGPAAGAAWVVVLAVKGPAVWDSSPKMGLAVPIIVLAGLLASRWPRVAMAALLVVAGAYGTIDAYTGYHSASVADLLIAALLVSVVGRLLFSRREYPIRPSPALFMLAAYLLVTIVGVLAVDPVSRGVRGFRLAEWHLAAAVIIGYGAFRARTLKDVGHIAALIALLVGAYATLRWAIGASAKEKAVNQSQSFFTIYNQTEVGQDKVQGSFPNGQALGVWMACAIPFLFAMALAWRGRWRWVAIAALPLSIIGLIGSGQRTGVAAAVVGCLLILIVHVLSRGFQGPRLGIALAAVVVLTAAAVVAYPAVANDPVKRQRYSNLFTPTEDLSFQQRLTKWNAVLNDLKGHTFGYGIGTGDALAIPHRFADVATYNIDNSYLMLAWDQGLIVMGLFVATLLVVLIELLRFAVWTRGPSEAAFATAAVGTLVAMIIEMFAANHIDAPAIIAGWVIVGLGIAQFGSRRPPALPRTARPAGP